MAGKRVLAAAAVGALLAAGCSAERGRPSPAPPSQEIRATDFADAEWHDAVFGTTVRLVGGRAEVDLDPVFYPGGVSWRLLDAPAYTDIDGDGDEDAAVGLRSAGGQTAATSWYLWLWQDGRAVQVRRPAVSVSRCEGPIESVTAKPGAIGVRLLVAGSPRDTCASGGSVPVTFEVGLRDGWPVRTSPAFGPVETCNPRDLTTELTPPGEVQLRVAGDPSAPAVADRTRYPAVLVDDLVVNPYRLPGRKPTDWHLVLALLPADTGPREVCGWAHVDELLPR